MFYLIYFKLVGRFPEWEAVADFVEVCHVDFDGADAGFPFIE